MSSGQGEKSLVKKCKEVFLKMDVFSNPQFLKYKGEGSYQTYTGSTISLIISVLFIAIFYNYCQQTIDGKITITPKLRPSLSTSFNTNQSNSAFMFAVGIEGVDLTSQKSFFNIVMSSKVYKNGTEFSSQQTPLEPCLPQQWEGINDQFKKTYARLNFKQWLCPPKNHNFTFKGKYTSQEFQYTKIVVHRCQSSTSVSCASQDDFSNLLMNQKTLKLSIYFANPIIDASQKQYLDYVLEDTNYFQFTDLIGVSSYIFFSEYEVNTDRSVYPEPFSDVTTERGLTLNERPVVSNFEIINTDELVRIYLRKSDLIQQFDRSYTRFDATFAYLGGLFGMVLMLFYGMRAFSEYAFEFQIGSHLFVEDDKDGSEFESGKFHILRFPIYLLYCIVTFFYEPAQEWSCFSFEDKVDKCREEVNEQTDVCQLIKRMLFMEKVLSLVCHRQMNRLNIDNKWTIDEARQMRNLYKKEGQHNHQQIKNFILVSENKAAKRRELSRAKTKSVQRAAPEIRPIEIDRQDIIIEQKNEEILEAPDFSDGGEYKSGVAEDSIKISMKKEHERQNSLGIVENDASSNMEFNMNPLRQSGQQNLPNKGSKTNSEQKKSSSLGSKKDLIEDQENLSPEWSKQYQRQGQNRLRHSNS